MRINLPKRLDLLIFCINSLNFSFEFFIMIFLKVHCCYLRASVGIGIAILPLEGICPQIKRAKVLYKTKTNSLPLICNSIFQTGRQWL